MKLPVAVLATLCAVGCEVAQAPDPIYPTQPTEAYETPDPTIETVEQEHFAQPPSQPAVAPVRRVVVQPVPVQPQITHADPCPACGMGEILDRLIHTGIALFAAEELRLAALPLFEAGVIEAIEWTFDHGWGAPPPAWVTALLEAYAVEDRLYGHGLRLSPTSARFDDDSRRWLARVAGDLGARRYRHATEHWGWSRARGLSRGAPMPLPSCEAAIACTTQAMRAYAAVAGVPVGLENLALALSDEDVDAQPAMLARVLDAIDGVLLLDLHNLWCQAINYRRDPRELAARYPLARVRQLHVAGGSWSDGFRRDTHDGAVPDEVLDLLAWIIPRCPALETVILERLPHALADEPAREQWRDEWKTIDQIARTAREPVAMPAIAHALIDHEATVDDLAAFQDAMAAALVEGDVEQLVHTAFGDQVARWDARAIDVARVLARTWGVS